MTEADRQKLQVASTRVVNLALGFHECDFCVGGAEFRGNGEYHYYLTGGEVYSAPVMVLHYVEEHDYRLPEVFREGLRSTAELAWDGRAERLCEILADRSQDEDFRCQAITDLPHWRDPRAFQALLSAIQDGELVDIVGHEIGRSLASYLDCEFAAQIDFADLPDVVKFGLEMAS